MSGPFLSVVFAYRHTLKKTGYGLVGLQTATWEVTGAAVYEFITTRR